MSTSYSNHPIFHLRMCLLVSGAIGIALSLLLVSWAIGALGFVFLMLAISVLFCISDLITWVAAKAASPNVEPAWPRRSYLVGDSVLALLLQWMFWPVLVSSTLSYGGASVLGAYAALPLFISSILHFVCFWKELMARKKAQWRASLPILPCFECGAVQGEADNTQTQPENLHRDYDVVDDLRSRFYMDTPADVSNESDILVGDAPQSGYGAIDPRSTTHPIRPSTKGKRAKSSSARE